MADVPQANFLNFLSGLGSQALMQLGEIPNPMTGDREANLGYARYTLELLQVLAEKTAGNLDEQEDAYLKGVIVDVADRLARLESAGG